MARRLQAERAKWELERERTLLAERDQVPTHQILHHKTSLHTHRVFMMTFETPSFVSMPRPFRES